MRHEEPNIFFGPRNESLHYRKNGRTTGVGIGGHPVCTMEPKYIKRWDRDGQEIPAEEKTQIFRELVQFARVYVRRFKVVLSIDDPDIDLWNSVCQSEQVEVEYTSEMVSEFLAWAHILKTTNGFEVEGQFIRTEQDIRDYLEKKYGSGNIKRHF